MRNKFLLFISPQPVIFCDDSMKRLGLEDCLGVHCVCMRVHGCVCMCVHMCVHVCVHACARVCVYMCACVCCVYTHVQAPADGDELTTDPSAALKSD